MLLWNVSLDTGLVNGSTGTILDFIYAPGVVSPSPPTHIVIDFPDYRGPAFYDDPARRTWVPLAPQMFEWDDSKNNSHYRTQYPIALAYALTVWKSQGMTIDWKLALEMGVSEVATGGTYVALSRATKIENVYIGNAIPYERISSMITKSKAFQRRTTEDTRLKAKAEITRTVFNV